MLKINQGFYKNRIHCTLKQDHGGIDWKLNLIHDIDIDLNVAIIQ